MIRTTLDHLYRFSYAAYKQKNSMYPRFLKLFSSLAPLMNKNSKATMWMYFKK